MDFACAAGAIVLSPVSGVVTRLGYAYADDLSYRYVEVEDESNKRHRIFYISPTISVGSEVYSQTTQIGIVQDLTKRYPNGMTNHVHYEVKSDGKFVNPCAA